MHLRACVAACLSARQTYQKTPIPWGWSVFSSVYQFVNPGIPCPGLPRTFFPVCLKYDLFRKTILTICVYHAFCERLYLCDFNRESLQSREVVQTFNRTSLSDRVADSVRDFGNPAKIQGRTQKFHVPAPPKCQASRVKK